MLEMDYNKHLFHQLSHLSVLSNIRNKNYGKTKKLQQKTNHNNKNYAKTKTNKNKKKNGVSNFRTLRIIGVCGLTGGLVQLHYLTCPSWQHYQLSQMQHGEACQLQYQQKLLLY